MKFIMLMIMFMIIFFVEQRTSFIYLFIQQNNKELLLSLECFGCMSYYQTEICQFLLIHNI